jgi:hypothetical protein
MSIRRLSILAAGLLAVGALSACENRHHEHHAMAAKTTDLVAALSPAKEVPPKSGAGTGFAVVSYNESAGTVSWKVYYTGLSGPATGAHFHGPAEKTGNAGVAINLVAAGAPASPITGTAPVTPAQAADLMGGRWYINVHTQANPGGEIRGQVAMDPW